MSPTTSTRPAWRRPQLLALGLPAALVSQCAPTQCAPAPAPVTYTVGHVVDGDTVDVTAADGSSSRIRIIGIDAPETGSCEAAKATSALAGLVDGRAVTLSSGARDDVDRYGRLLRYVDVQGVDAGKRLIEGGLAVARYDGRDGYGAHPRQAAYVAADAASPAYACGPATPPPTSVYYANCDAVRAAGKAPLRAGQPGYETPRLDRDGDGIACE